MYKKGYKFERDLKQELEKKGWKVIRSGGSKKPDLIAAKKGKIIIIECKITQNNKAYLNEDEVQNLKKCAKEFNCEGMYAIKQKHKGWNLVSLSKLKRVGKMYVINLN